MQRISGMPIENRNHKTRPSAMDSWISKLSNSNLVQLIHAPFGLATLMINGDKGWSSPVPHLNVFATANASTAKELPWDKAFGSTGFAINSDVFIIGWHDPFETMSAPPTEPMPFNSMQSQMAEFKSESQQTVRVSHISRIDPITRSFCIANSFNQLGPGNSGGLIVGIYQNTPILLGFINSLTDDNHTLRCVRTDSRWVKDQYPNDTEIFKLRRPSHDDVAKIVHNVLMYRPSLLNLEGIKASAAHIQDKFQHPDRKFYPHADSYGNHWEPKKNGLNFDLRDFNLNKKEQVTLAIELCFQSLNDQIKAYEIKHNAEFNSIHVPRKINQFSDIFTRGQYYQGPTNATHSFDAMLKNKLIGIKFNINFDQELNVKGKSPKSDHVGFYIQIGSQQKETGHIMIDSLANHHR